jgi:predicted extracellular nuclease
MKKIMVLFMISFTIVNATTIYEIQTGEISVGESVQIQGIVTAANGETPDGDGSFYIQDGAGAYNGINVISSDYTVSRGDLVELYGEYVEYYGKSEISEPENLDILSSGNTLPEPEVLSLSQADWEPWEGVLIQIQNVAVSNDDAEFGEWDVSDLSGANTMRIDNAGNYTYSPSNGDQFETITGPLNYTYDFFKIIPRDDLDIVQGSPPDISNVSYSPSVPTESSDVTVSAEIADNGSISTALLTYNAGSGEMEVFMANTTGNTYEGTIPVQVAGTQVVFQIRAVDNDGFFSESAEIGYMVLPSGAEVVDIYDIQYTTDPSGDSPMAGEEVTINGVVTAEFWGGDNKRIFVQDDEGPWAGILVYESGGWDNMDILSPEGVVHSVAEGDNVMLTGTVTEYNGMTQITDVSSIADLGPSSFEIPSSVVTPGQIMTGGTEAEAYEGCLVKVETVSVDNPDLGNGEWSITDGSNSVRVDDHWDYYFFPETGQSLTEVAGCMDYSSSNTKIQPRIARDVVEDGVTRIQRVQQVLYSDLLKAGSDSESDKSYLSDETVTLEGIVTMPTGLSYAGNGVKFIFEDEHGGPWSAILSYDPDSSAFPILFEGDVVQATGYISEYSTGESNMTELFITQPVNLINIGEMPEVSDISTGDLRWPTTAEQWGNVMVRVNNTVVTGNDFQYEVFAVDDGSGTVLIDDDADSIFVYFDQVGPPPVGTSIESIRGWVYHHYGYYNDSTTYKLEPLYASDIVFGSGPPSMMNVDRNPCIPDSDDEVLISCNINDNSSVVSAEIMYSVNGGSYQSVAMNNLGGASWTGTIPATNSEGERVNYYIQAVDDGVDQDGIETGTYPFDSSFDQLEYITRDGDLFISDIQYTNWSAGNSPFDGCEVTVTGIVTAGDEVYGADEVYAIQSESGAWNGIIFDGWEGAQFTLGDEVTVTGTVEEYDPVWHYRWDNNTKLTNVANSTLNSSGNSVLPVTVTTENLAEESNDVESYEGCLVTIANVTVNDLNDYDWSVVDDSGVECLIDDDWADSEAATLLGSLQAGSTIGSITGIFNFSFGSYKIQVRNILDITDLQLDVDEVFITKPYTFTLHSNYPNPFNPETRLRFEVGAQVDVKLSVYDVLGRIIRSFDKQEYTPGRYIINWDGKDNNGSYVSSGIYIYRMKAGDFVDHKKMTLIR